jgi:hypothetical protein
MSGKNFGTKSQRLIASRAGIMPVTRLYPITPYDFHLSAMIFAGGDPQIRTYKQGIFRQVLDIQGTAVLVEVFSKGTPDAQELYFTIQPDDALTGDGKTGVSSLISSMFNKRGFSPVLPGNGKGQHYGLSRRPVARVEKFDHTDSF